MEKHEAYAVEDEAYYPAETDAAAFYASAFEFAKVSTRMATDGHDILVGSAVGAAVVLYVARSKSPEDLQRAQILLDTHMGDIATHAPPHIFHWMREQGLQLPKYIEDYIA